MQMKKGNCFFFKFQAACIDSSNRCNAYSGDAPFLSPIWPLGKSSNGSAA